MNIRDRERDMYVYEQRKKGRTYASIAADMGLTEDEWKNREE